MSSTSITRTRRLTWPAARETFLTHMRARGMSALTIKGYLLEVDHLHEHLGRERAPRPDAVAVEHLREYVCGLLTGAASRQRKPLSAGTAARITTQLGSFFSFLEREGLIRNDPTRRLERPRAPQRAPGNVLTKKEVTALLAAPSPTTPLGLRDRALVETLYATGLRRNEVLDLDLADLDQAERLVTVERGKGGKGRVVPLTRSAFHRVIEYLERGRPSLADTAKPDALNAVFLSERGARLSEGAILKTIRRLAQHAGIKKRISPHTLRRTFATDLLKGGASLRHIQLLLGHAKLSTTAIYLNVDPSELRREILLKHPRERMDP